MNNITITECPRDAMQGITEFIPTELKINYLNQLLKVGFYALDFGSFVSPKAIPQMKDSSTVAENLIKNNTKLLAIIANERGAESACLHRNIDVLGFPFSISEQFQLRNTNSSRKEALQRVKQIKEIADSEKKHSRIYLSMAFGNPYKEEWNEDIIKRWASELYELGIKEIVLSDTTGVATKEKIKVAFSALKNLQELELSCHFHSKVNEWNEKISTAFEQGCYSFDSALKGIGGCPMADDELVGNIATENVLDHFKEKATQHLNLEELKKAFHLADDLFSKYH